MRYFLTFFAAILFITNPTLTEDENVKTKESIIIEVEGNPEEHKAYLELHHPFIDVITTYNTLFNGLALQGTPEKLSKIASLEFIKVIHPVQTYEALSIDSYILPDASKQTNIVMPSDLNNTNFTGKGIKVGVIDTGIDYNHPDLLKNYMSGYDLVDLDDDPMETIPAQGIPTLHGTHVAGIIAANGDLKGVAPDAAIYAYRALGPGGMGSSIQVIAAMEQAVEDGVDIINMSLGNAVNGPDYPTSVAVNRATNFGVAVVIANGNDGPGNWTVGSPATATKALSVGASTNPVRIPYLSEPSKDKKINLSLMLGSLPWTFDKDYKIASLTKQQPNPEVKGKIALIERGEIPFYELAKEAQKDGAIAVVIYNNEAGSFQGSVDHEESPVNIPVAAISKEDGNWLFDQIQTEPVYIETLYEQTKAAIAPFSSRGPVTINWDIKPDILAPGTNIMSTIPGGYQALQGTSMAAPHVAGVIALLKEAQPNWSNEQIIGALKTTALRVDSEDGSPVDPIIQGMGQIRPQKAVDTKTIIYDPLLVFGKINAYKEAKTVQLTIENTTDEAQTYAFEIPEKQRGLNWKLPQSFTLEKKERKVIPVELNITTAQLTEGIHQDWLTLSTQKEKYHLPYLFVNQTADHPKAMGFDFSLKSFTDNLYEYSFYITEPTQSIKVHLYDPDTLLYDRPLLELTEIKVGMNKGQMKQSELGKPGKYKAIITVQLKSGEYESHETEVLLE